jgi:hypothetical protein
MAAVAKDEGKSLYDWLLQMYIDFGYYKEGLINLVRKGAEGEQQIKDMMTNFRNSPPAILAGERVVRKLDYKSSEEVSLLDGTKTPIHFLNLMCCNSTPKVETKYRCGLLVPSRR